MALHRMRHGTTAQRFHERLKRDRVLWSRLVIEIGTMDDGAGHTLTLGNCRVCMSTIAREAKHG